MHPTLPHFVPQSQSSLADSRLCSNGEPRRCGDRFQELATILDLEKIRTAVAIPVEIFRTYCDVLQVLLR